MGNNGGKAPDSNTLPENSIFSNFILDFLLMVLFWLVGGRKLFLPMADPASALWFYIVRVKKLTVYPDPHSYHFPALMGWSAIICQHRSCCLQIARIKTLTEPAQDSPQQAACLVDLPLLHPQPPQAECRAQLQRPVGLAQGDDLISSGRKTRNPTVSW